MKNGRELGNERINPSVSPVGQEKVRGQALYERENELRKGRDGKEEFDKMNLGD
jgi:hypothetical protein